MGWTKRQFVEQAYEEIGLAAYTFDLQPDQLLAAVRRLDAMMATWNGKGIRLGYPIPGSPENSNIDDETNVPDAANEAIYTNLAIRLGPPIGKVVSQETKQAAKDAFDGLLRRAAMPPEMQYTSTLPLGAGNKPWRNSQPFVTPPTDPVLAGQDGVIDFT